MPNYLLKLLLVLAATTATTLAHAQSPADPTYHAPTHQAWPTPTDIREVMHLDVVTFDHPKLRHECIIPRVEGDVLTCDQSGSKPQITYRRQDIAALIFPAHNSHWLLHVALCFFSGSAIMYGAYVLGAVTFGGAVVVGIIAAIVISSSPLFAYDRDSDVAHDRLLYQAPNTQLAVPLK